MKAELNGDLLKYIFYTEMAVQKYKNRALVTWSLQHMPSSQRTNRPQKYLNKLRRN